jgi:cystathionine beta-lyase/cystathionine gamma-synthase
MSEESGRRPLSPHTLAGHLGREPSRHLGAVNTPVYRASTMVFLYRAIVRRDDPATAYEAVARVWSPQGPWRALVVALLARHGIAFEPY